MTKSECATIQQEVEVYRKVVNIYYQQGESTGEWKNHEIACASLRAVRELAEKLGIDAE